MSDYYGYIHGCTCEFCDKERAREAEDKAAAELAATEAKEAHPVPTTRLLTKEMVLRGSPCYEYRNRFNERYGKDGVMVTVEKALNESEDWDWEWAGSILLSRKAKAEFSRRSREAEKVWDDTMRPYQQIMDEAYNKYYQVRDEAVRSEEYQNLRTWNARDAFINKASEGVLTIPNAAYTAADEIARKIRRDARITAFAELFITDGAAYEEEHKNDGPVYDPDTDTYTDEDGDDEGYTGDNDY